MTHDKPLLPDEYTIWITNFSWCVKTFYSITLFIKLKASDFFKYYLLLFNIQSNSLKKTNLKYKKKSTKQETYQ